MTDDLVFASVDLQRLTRVAQLLALVTRRGDLIALRGDLGAGKTTLARALIEAIAATAQEVPSPTFSLVQHYRTERLAIAHLDLYRVKEPEELDELGLEEALAEGLTLVEWPEHAGARLPADRLDVLLSEGDRPDTRRVLLAATCLSWRERLARLAAIDRFLDAAGWAQGTVAYLQGDASPRGYARLTRDTGASAVLMNAPRQPDGPPVRDGKPYSRIAHLAEDVRPFVAVDRALRRVGLSAPQILAADLDAGLLLLEDLGDAVLGRLVAAGADQGALWEAALDTLVALRRAAPDTTCPLDGGPPHRLPRLDGVILEMESDLLLDWYWPEVKRAPASPDVRAAFRAAWAPLIEVLTRPEKKGWILRDYHSPNLIWLPEREGAARIGVLDFQDALEGPWAHDVMSLLQDARLDVPPELEARLLARYCRAVAALDARFEEADFRRSYAIYGALRSTRLIGLWVRLLRRDGKPQYLQHMPRTWAYLERNLQHPALAAVRAWYDTHLPPHERTSAIAR